MKKIFLGLAVTASALLSSCSMDTTNFGVMGQDVAIQSVDDVRKYDVGLYANLRSITGGDWIANPEIQADKFVGTVGNGNRGGNFSLNNFTADLSAGYQGAYNVINNANYVIPYIEAMLQDEKFDADQKLELRRYLGDAHFVRGFCYWFLLDRFSKPGDNNYYGFQIWDVYNPSGNRSSYPARATMAESITKLNSELNEAFNNLKAWEDAGNLDNCGPNAIYLSSYAVAALQARVALITNDYPTALSKAEYVITSGNYELTDIDDYADLWVNDEGNELIFVPFGDSNEGCPATGEAWLANTSKNTSDYIPTAEAINAYSADDVRGEAFFTTYTFEMSGLSPDVTVFNKFPGNPALFRPSPNLENRPKPFRLSELYLIAAEVCATDGATKNESKANGYLNDLRAKRIRGYNSVTYAGAALLSAIREERTKELIGEGFRISDLRRWGQGITRNTSLGSSVMEIVLTASNNVSLEAGNYHMVWPIPSNEFKVNPNITGQQNPGY